MNATVLNPHDRVRRNTSAKLNFRIDKDSFERLKQLRRDGPQAIKARLRELEKEWDIDRALALNASALALAGVVLGSTVDKKWYILTGVVAAFLAQHSIQGWCPPLPVMRSLGMRTQNEIDEERELLLRML